MNTADLHLKRFPLSLTVGQLRELAHELQTMENAPHLAPVSPDKQIERDRAGEQLMTHISMLVIDTKEQDEGAQVVDSLPLLRTSAKYLLTACDRCRREALRRALRSLTTGEALGPLLSQIQSWDATMRQLSTQHGVSSPLRELVEPVPMTPEELTRLGLTRDALFNGEEVLARF